MSLWSPFSNLEVVKGVRMSKSNFQHDTVNQLDSLYIIQNWSNSVSDIRSQSVKFRWIRWNSGEFGRIRETECALSKFGLGFGKPNNSVKFGFGQNRIPKKWIRPRLLSNEDIFVAPLAPAHGTLVCCGTPVGNHWGDSSAAFRQPLHIPPSKTCFEIISD